MVDRRVDHDDGDDDDDDDDDVLELKVELVKLVLS